MCFNEYSCSKADWIGGQVSLQFEIGMVNGQGVKILLWKGEKFLTQFTTDVKLWTRGRWVGTQTGAGVTATLV